jgi:hypothetical protein
MQTNTKVRGSFSDIDPEHNEIGSRIKQKEGSSRKFFDVAFLAPFGIRQAGQPQRVCTLGNHLDVLVAGVFLHSSEI